jgi:hypothetical protein
MDHTPTTGLTISLADGQVAHQLLSFNTTASLNFMTWITHRIVHVIGRSWV